MQFKTQQAFFWEKVVGTPFIVNIQVLIMRTCFYFVSGDLVKGFISFERK